MNGHYDCLAYFSENKEYKITQKAFVEAIKQNNLTMLDFLCKKFKHMRSYTNSIYNHMWENDRINCVCKNNGNRFVRHTYACLWKKYNTVHGISYYKPENSPIIEILQKNGFVDKTIITRAIHDNNMKN